jgi:hypothetical protein
MQGCEEQVIYKKTPMEKEESRRDGKYRRIENNAE